MAPRKLGRVIRQLREDAGLTQGQLAKKASVTEAYVSMLEAGKRRSPTLEVLKRLAKALGVHVTELLG